MAIIKFLDPILALNKNHRYVITLLFSLFSFTTFSQSGFSLLDDPNTSDKILVGSCNIEALVNPSLNFFHQPEYENYTPIPNAIVELSNQAQNFTITIVLGTWCGDSKEQVPGFLKILDLIEFNSGNVTILGVDRQKLAGEIDIHHLNILRVPTFIFYQNKIEIGRIIEFPVHSLEEDMLHILKTRTH